MDRPVRPDPTEFPRIKRAMRAARFMKWGATPIAGLAMLISVVVGAGIAPYVGVLTFLLSCGALVLIGFGFARCPHCGQVWWPSPFLHAPWRPASKEFLPEEDETESFVCRRCRIDIGQAFRD